MKHFNLLSSFLNRSVIVEAGEFKVKGKLVYFKEGYREGHLPTVLTLQNECGKIILRTWSVIKTVR
ncbi:MAG: hypothetical protein QXI91_05505 [Candidatus Bathyarchaeia archaeon]